MSTELVIPDNMDPVLARKIARAELQPAQDIAPTSAAEMKRRYDVIQDLIRDVMKEGVDYGSIPNVEGQMLFKPGAETLGVAFNIATSFEPVNTIEDWNAGLFHYEVKCELRTRDGKLIASANGSCNSRESKYRYRWVTLDKPDDPKKVDELIRRGMAKLSNTRHGEWYRERVENPDIYDLINTIQKMAAKRAHVAAIRLGLGVSGIFENGEEAEHEEKRERGPSREDREKAAKAAFVKAVMQVTGKGQKEAGPIAGTFWEQFGLPNSDDELHRCLIDIAISLASGAPDEAPDEEVDSTPAESGASDGFARSLGQLLRDVKNAPVAEFKELLADADEATQGDWLNALKDTDAEGRAQMVTDFVAERGDS